MEQCMVEADVISFNSAMSACEKARRWLKAFGLLIDMIRRGLVPDVTGLLLRNLV